MNERGGILTRLVISIAILALIAFQGGALVVAKVQVDGIAVNAAEDAALEFGRSGSTDRARAVAEHIAEISGATVTAFGVDPQRQVVVVTVQKRARVFLIDKIGALKKYTVETSTHEGTIR